MLNTAEKATNVEMIPWFIPPILANCQAKVIVIKYKKLKAAFKTMGIKFSKVNLPSFVHHAESTGLNHLLFFLK